MPCHCACSLFGLWCMCMWIVNALARCCERCERWIMVRWHRLDGNSCIQTQSNIYKYVSISALNLLRRKCTRGSFLLMSQLFVSRGLFAFFTRVCATIFFFPLAMIKTTKNTHTQAKQKIPHFSLLRTKWVKIHASLRNIVDDDLRWLRSMQNECEWGEKCEKSVCDLPFAVWNRKNDTINFI